MSKKTTGACIECGYRRPIRQNGTIRPHKSKNGEECPGSSRKPVVEEWLQTPIEKLAHEVHKAADMLDQRIANFVSVGGQVNIEIWHSEGSESLTLQQLNGEMTVQTLKIEEIEP